MNLVVHASNPRYPGDLELVEKYKVPVVLTSKGAPGDAIKRIHGWGAVALHDIANRRHAEKALEAGVDGVIAVAGGAGGHTGTINPFALMNEVRQLGDHFAIVLAGGLTTGRDVLAAAGDGRRPRPISARASSPRARRWRPTAHKKMILDTRATDVFLTSSIDGAPANWLTPSLLAAGIDLDVLRTTLPSKVVAAQENKKRWKDIYTAGHGVGNIERHPDGGRALPPADRAVPRGPAQAAAGRGVSVTKIQIDRLAKTFGEEEQRTVALHDFTCRWPTASSSASWARAAAARPRCCASSPASRRRAAARSRSRPASTGRPQNAMVFQEHGLFPWMTVEDNVAYSLEMRGVAQARAARAGRLPFLEKIGLTRFHGHYPQQLSGGMRQRVSLARAFVADPEILLMDEPFAALDAQNKLILQDELLRIWEGRPKTVLFITHGIDEAIALGDRIVVMTAQPGRIKEIVPIDFPRPRSVAELRADPRFGALELSIWRMLEDEVRDRAPRRPRAGR